MFDVLETVDHAGQAEAGPEEGEAEHSGQGPGHEARGAGGVCCYVLLTVGTSDSGGLRSKLRHCDLQTIII